MNAQGESEQLQNFHERLSQWVASQGFWFQLRYSMSRTGGKGSVFFHLFSIFTRLAIFAVVVGLGLWFFLIKQAGTDNFQTKVRASLKERLGAEEVQVVGFSRDQGTLSINRMAMSGGDETFFTGLELRNLRCRMGLMDGFSKVWDPGQVSISRMEIGLRAGADSEESSGAIAKVLFQDTGRLKLSVIEVADMSLRWGYSERTRGEILGSRMTALRLENGWRLTFRGGSFSQNWLQRLEIEELEVVFGEKGVVFEKVVLRKGGGYLTLAEGRVAAGQRPQVSGVLSLSEVELSAFLPPVLREYADGRISGELRVFGSTNSSDGVGFEGEVELAAEDQVTLRDRLPLLRALSVVDAFNNYRRIDFNKGSFGIRTHGGEVEVSDVILASDAGVSLKGDLAVRYPTAEEEATLGEFGEEGENYVEGILSEDELAERRDVTLENAGRAATAGGGFDEAAGLSLSERLGLNIATRRLDERTAGKLSRYYRYVGDFVLVLPGGVFDRAPNLEEKFPEVNGKVFLDVPINGYLHELTKEQSDEIYELGRR